MVNHELRLKSLYFLLAGDELNYLPNLSATSSAKYVIIATGFYDIPYKLNVPGEDLNKVKHYYDDPHPYFGMKIAVIGAGNSAVDVALENYRKGSKEVTMIIRESKLKKSVK